MPPADERLGGVDRSGAGLGDWVVPDLELTLAHAAPDVAHERYPARVVLRANGATGTDQGRESQRVGGERGDQERQVDPPRAVADVLADRRVREAQLERCRDRG